MTIKTKILARLSPRQMRAVCDAVGVRTTDRRYGEALRSDISAARAATPERILEVLDLAELRALAAELGVPDTGRRGTVIEAILDGSSTGARPVPARPAGRPRNGGAGAPAKAGREREPHANPASRRIPPAEKAERSRRRPGVSESTQQYRHANEAVQRPDVGVQDHFQTRKPPRTYRYDSSLDPALSWDEQRERDLGEWLLGLSERAAVDGEKSVFAEAQEWKGGGVRVSSTADAVGVLKSIAKPFLNWAGKAERHQIKVPSVPLFVHEGHSTKAILDGIRHRKARGSTLDLFGDSQMDVRENLEAYEHKGSWQNRMILGDSLAVMDSLLEFEFEFEFEGLAGQVQMIYIDPPYGVKFTCALGPRS